jgi:GNAT superfamily N-acetyltransferase
MATIRPARLADEAAALDLLEELFAPPGRRPLDYTRERGAAGFRHAVTRPDAVVLLAVEGDAVVGLVSAYVDFASMRFGWRCWVEDLVVASSCRSGGVGRRLIEAASDWAQARGCTHLELDSAPQRADAHRFYLANGFAQSAYVFARPLAPR